MIGTNEFRLLQREAHVIAVIENHHTYKHRPVLEVHNSKVAIAAWNVMNFTWVHE